MLLCGGAAGATTAARADIQGFGTFAPANRSGSATGTGISGAVFTLTDGSRQQSTSGFAPAPQRIDSFTASFTYRATDLGDSGGDGIALVFQNDPRGSGALGDHGDALGYGGSSAITRSAAVRLMLYPGSGEGLGANGNANISAATVPVDLRSGHPIRVTVDYDGAAIRETLKDLTTGDTYTEVHDADIPGAVGGPTALVGFTGASGDAVARQSIRGFTFTERPPVPVARRRHAVKRVRTYTTLTSYVDPLIGTAAGGNTYPGAVMPFGMVQLSPDTRKNGIGYNYEDREIQGFSLTHMSGVGCDDYGNVFLTATAGDVKTDVADYSSIYTHRSESASPGYYKVTLLRPKIDAELTATLHAGLIRFTFPAGQPANVLVPISHTLTYTRSAQIRVIGDHEIVGEVSSQSFCGAQQFFTVYFVMELDQPFRKFGTFAGATKMAGSRSANQAEKQPPVGAYVSYPAGVRRVVTARIGISFVDLDGARRNLQSEVGARPFDEIRRQTDAAWEKELAVLNVHGGTPDQKSVFYTSLYHCLLMPNVFNDVDGRYMGFDNHVHRVAAGHSLYANYSGWDIYRNEASLLALIAPQRAQDMCESIALMYRQGGWIDRWPQANTYTNVMCGSPLTSFVATAWNYGLHGFDIATAYEGMLKDALQPAPPGKPYQGQANIAWMDRVGYIPEDKEGYGSVSQTEEDCYAYAALSSIAASRGKTDDAARLHTRALFYRNLFDPTTRFLRPRNADGSWSAPFDPNQEKGYVEGTGWHYRWLVPHDVAGLIHLFGGDDTFNKELDTFFAYARPGWTSHLYNPYNETDLQAPFLYDYSGAPWKTQETVRRLLTDVYTTRPGGIPGNDDCGTMSAWCVFAMMGLYPTDPARPAFELCSPVFDRVTMRLAAPYTGKAFTISAPAASTENVYIRKVTINGADHARPWISQDVIANGGSVSFDLGAQPDKQWGSAMDLRPPSLSDK